MVEGVDKTKLSNDIKSKVDAIDSFPAETEKPVTAEVTYVATVLQVALSGDADERTLKLLGQQLRDDGVLAQFRQQVAAVKCEAQLGAVLGAFGEALGQQLVGN